MDMTTSIPVIDLFAGPGGLGEGFSAYPLSGMPVFSVALSVEKEQEAHRTLLLRSFFRQFPRGEVPNDYYRYVRHEITREGLFERHNEQFDAAREQCQRIEIGPGTRRKIRELIRSRVARRRGWVLILGSCLPDSGGLRFLTTVIGMCALQ